MQRYEIIRKLENLERRELENEVLATRNALAEGVLKRGKIKEIMVRYVVNNFGKVGNKGFEKLVI